MSLSFAAFVPHPPLLIPDIGQNNLKRLKDTQLAYEKIRQELKTVRPDVLVVISPHGQILGNNFTINARDEFKVNFEEFGIFSINEIYKNDQALAQLFQEAEAGNIKIRFVANEILDHGSAIPVFLINNTKPFWPIIQVGYSELDNKNHYDFGVLLQKEIIYSTKRIAVIASGDLSHRLSRQAPGGYDPKAKKFDQKIKESLSAGNINDILNIDQQLAESAGECGLRSLIILLGILDKIKYQPQILSYEAPFGVGYLTVNFKMDSLLTL